MTTISKKAQKHSPPTTVEHILPILFTASKIDFSLYKLPTLKRAIHKRMAALRLQTISEYAQYLKRNPKEAQTLSQSMLIKVTKFFRDPEVFDVLKRKVFPNINRGKNTPLRVWVPGCCTGEEVYSLAIALTEFLGGKNSSLQIFGSDLSEESLNKARSGTYSKKELNGLKRKYIERYFTLLNGQYHIDKNIRGICTFAKQDLIHDAPFSRLDIISCRNLLIYLKPEVQDKIIKIFHYALNPKGFLVLGKSENIGTPAPVLFDLLDKKKSIYTKKTGAGETNMLFRINPSPLRNIPEEFKNLSSPQFKIDLNREMDRLLIERSGHAAILINEANEIIQSRGNVAAYFQIPSGKMSAHIFRMAQDKLAVDLEMLLKKARAGGKPISKSVDTTRQKIEVEIVPVHKSLLKERNFIILISPQNGHLEETEPKKAVSENQKIRYLQRELNHTKAWTQSLIEEHENTIQELKSAHEEVLSSNEELQSLNEELHTSQEELESTNEELTTVNEQLQHQIEAVRQSEEKFRILVESVKEYAIFMLDPAGHIVTWNIGAERLKGYKPTEIIGKHFSIFYPPPDQVKKKPQKELVYAVKHGAYKEEGWRVRKDGSLFWASVTITTLKDKNGKLRGFSKVTRDMTERMRAEELLRNTNIELEKRVKERTEQLERNSEELMRSNADLQQFAYVASHDLQEPLRSVSVYADLLERQLKENDNPKVAEFLKFLKEGATRSQRLIRELLEYSRIDVKDDPFTRIKMDDVIKHVLSLLGVMIKESGAKITCDPLPVVTANHLQMEQVFQNLISNAIKYRSQAAPKIRIGAHKNKRQWVFSVKDNGLGIEPPYHQSIFTVFKRLHSVHDYPGTGIGLALCKKIVNRHGGNIWVESDGRHGSTFFFTIPESKR